MYVVRISFCTFAANQTKHTHMKKQIIEALKAKFPDVGEASLLPLAGSLAKSVKTAEAATSAVEAATIVQIIEAKAAEAATTAAGKAVKDYETKYGIKDGVKASDTPTTTRTATAPGGEPAPAWAAALIEANAALAAQVKAIQSEKLATTRRSEVDKIVEVLPEALRKPYSRLSLDALSDEQYAALKDEIASEAADIATAARQSGAVFGSPTPQPTPPDATTTTEAKAEEALSVAGSFV